MNYSGADVLASLQRLTEVASRQALQYPEGYQPLPPEAPAQYWQAIVSVAGDGKQELPGATLEQLRVLLNHVETVIISCGSPDSFEVYEVCFQVLTYLGAFLQTRAPKEMILKVLEEVNEVYDVLLSCVETYEWIDPGATGQLRLWMLEVLFACFGFDSITGRHLMELTDNDVSGAVSLVSFVLKTAEAPFEMQAAAGRCLVDLTTADCVFMDASGSGGGDWQNQQIAKLTAMLNRHVNGLIKGVIQFEIVEAFGRCICQHQMNHSYTDVIIKHFLTTIHNCLLYCSENQKKLRQHLATQSTIVPEIMIPYIHNVLPALYDNPNPGPKDIEWQNLKAALQTFVVVTFNINVLRPQLRDSDMIPKIFDVPNIMTHITMLELLIKLAVNVDFVRGPHADVVLARLQGAFASLPADQQSRLQRRMTSEQSMRLPFSKPNAQSMAALSFAMARPAEDEGAAETRRAQRRSKWRSSKNKARKRKRLFGMKATKKTWVPKGQQPGAPAPTAGLAEEEDEEEEDEGNSSDDDDMPPLIPAEGWEGTLGAADPEAGIPVKALCQLTGALMMDPVVTAEGNTFERAALEDWVAQAGTNPATGVQMGMDQVQTDTALQNSIQGYQMQMLSACQVAPEAFEHPPEAAARAPAPVRTGPSLLGALPGLGAGPERKQKKEKSKIRIESRSVVECPDEMRCSIDGKVMINPVISPYGHRFERKTLEKWITNCGSVCPVTQKPLRIEECQPDADMKRIIIKFLKNEA